MTEKIALNIVYDGFLYEVIVAGTSIVHIDRYDVHSSNKCPVDFAELEADIKEKIIRDVCKFLTKNLPSPRHTG